MPKDPQLSSRQLKNIALVIPIALLWPILFLFDVFKVKWDDTVIIVVSVFALTGISLLAFHTPPKRRERLKEVAMNLALPPIDITALLAQVPGPLLTQHKIQPRHPIYSDTTSKPFLFLFEATVGEQPSLHTVLILQGAPVNHEGISHLDQWCKGSDIGWSIFFKPSAEITRTEFKEIFSDLYGASFSFMFF